MLSGWVWYSHEGSCGKREAGKSVREERMKAEVVMMKFVAGSEDGERAHEPANGCCQLEKEPDPLPEPPEEQS